jgi:hypothetical protein
MIKYVFPAAVAALALGTMAGAPVVARAQMMAPQPTRMTPTTTANASTTITGQPQPGPDEYYNQGYVVPMPVPYVPARPISPRTTWIPGHYNWDPTTSNYVWTDGQYVEAPTATARWISGHWVQTPTSWTWINGGWN